MSDANEKYNVNKAKNKPTPMWVYILCFAVILFVGAFAVFLIGLNAQMNGINMDGIGNYGHYFLGILFLLFCALRWFIKFINED